MGLEADVAPQMKRLELVSSQAQSLTKKYQETKELLKLQELKKRNMQAQLRLSLSHSSLKDTKFTEQQEASSLAGCPSEPIQKTVSLLLQDSPEAIQELEDLATDKPLTLRELGKLLKCHSAYRKSTEKHELQELLETCKFQQEVEHELIKKNLARAGESIREYEARLLNMEDNMGKVERQSFVNQSRPYHSSLPKMEDLSETKEATVGLLSQRVKLLTEENGALKQRCQEIMNQLTEADREIDRLKAELNSQQSSKQHHPMTEELNKLKAELAENQANVIDREYYERELNEQSMQLHEALVTLEELGSTLADTEKKLQLKEATLIGLGFQADDYDKKLLPQKEQLRQLLETSQAKFFETKESLRAAEQHCVELEARNQELSTLNQEIEKVSKERLLEVENEVKMLRCELELNMGKDKQDWSIGKSFDAGQKQVDYKGLFEEVVGNLEMTCEAINQVVEMLAEVDTNVESMFRSLKSTLFTDSQEKTICLSDVDVISVLEWEFWSQLLSIPESETNKSRQICEAWLAEQIVALQSLLLLKRRVCLPAEAQRESEAVFASVYSCLDDETHAQVLTQLIKTLEEKFCSLKRIASTLKSDRDDRLLSLAFESFGPVQDQKQSAEYFQVSLKEACFSYVIIRLQGWSKRELEHPINPLLNMIDIPSQSSETPADSVLEQGTLIQTEGELNDSVDETTELSDLVDRLKQELVIVKISYEQQTEKLKKELTETNEALHLQSRESNKRIDFLTNLMENLKKQHETERRKLTEQFDREMEELRNMMSPTNSDRNGTDEHTAFLQASPSTTLRERIQELLTQVSVMTEETRRREELGDITTLRLKYEQDLENLKVEVLLIYSVLPFVTPHFPLWHSQIPPT